MVISGGGLGLPSLASYSCFSSITKRAGLTRSTGGKGASDKPCFTIDFERDFFRISIPPFTLTLDTALLGPVTLGLGESVVFRGILGL